MIPREGAIAALAAERFDVVVIGGGITGAGVALDAASRGLSVALVERHDFASGTSSRSTKLIHGGLRYLRGLHLRLVREGLRERELMFRLAPRLVRRLPIVLPAFGDPRASRWEALGLTAYDFLAIGAGGPHERHRTISSDEIAKLVPALAARAPSAGRLYHDCQVDDARLVLTILAEAERRGAVCANRVEADELVERNGRAAGVLVRDAEGGATFAIASSRVVNATGAWADRILRDEVDGERAIPSLRPSRGTHITLRREDLPLNGAGLVVPDGRTRHISVLPWMGSTLVGATDVEHEGDLDDVRPRGEDVDSLLDAVNSAFGTTLVREDVAGAFAGARPLVAAGRARRSADVSRRAVLHESSTGMITITGGKLTTWRRMAQRTVDRLVQREGRRARCRTAEIPLAEPQDPRELPHTDRVPAAAYPHLADRYGRDAGEVLTIAASDPRLATPILAGHPDLLAEAAFAACHEQARSVGDVLLRRTRLGLLAARELCDPRATVATQVADAMAPELGWNGSRRRKHVAAWEAEARAEGIFVSVSDEPPRGTQGPDEPLRPDPGPVRRPVRACHQRRGGPDPEPAMNAQPETQQTGGA
jgi:glycerol-3-phosphate dehydrogenase